MGLGQVKTMRMRDVIDSTVGQLHDLLGLEVSNVIAVSKRDDGWQMTVELVERKAVPDTQDLLGAYAVSLDDDGELVSYERRSIRRRMDLEESVE